MLLSAVQTCVSHIIYQAVVVNLFVFYGSLSRSSAVFSPVHCIYLGSTSDIDLLQLKLFVALDLVERLDLFLLNPALTLTAVGQSEWTQCWSRMEVVLA